MKKIFFLLITFSFSFFAFAQNNAAKTQSKNSKPAATTATSATPSGKSAAGGQTQSTDFKQLLVEARSAHDAGKLDDARFAMQQMLYELDMLTGKEVLKLLPQKMMDKEAVAKLDNVFGASGFVGVIIHREWGAEQNTDNKNINMEIISNSPLVATVNGLLSLPLIGNTGDNKVVKINGYKALVSKVSDGDGFSYELQLPLNNSLIILKAPGLPQDQVIKAANNIPVQDIAKMLQ